ncbi:mitochondrial 54S ribosomal protein YmL3 [Paramyrothecium foliicola]|nr:mitochondrial 54S ribosomal protein YmL3 [Paramyrothecium foliicola]
MKRVRLSRWSGQVLAARSGASVPRQSFLNTAAVRCQSSAASVAHDIDDGLHAYDNDTSSRPLPSPLPERATQSAKLAALHARLILTNKVPRQTLARALVTPSADPNSNFNNASLAVLGSSIINYHVLEYLVCKWPRLPMTLLYEALRAYAGAQSLQRVAERWGVESAAAPGEEVDPGLLQWSPDSHHVNARWGFVRAEDARNNHYRRGVSSRVVLDNDFGDKVMEPNEENKYAVIQSEAFASCVQAVVGAIYTHRGRDAAKAFVTSHILSRQLDLSRMFQFENPTRELSMLCAREGFEAPLARLESETGRLSRTPVFVVGIYSGKDKLGEGAGASLVMARQKASMAALKAWYLYSPGNKVRVPSDMMEEGAKPWTPPYIDVGEIV